MAAAFLFLIAGVLNPAFADTTPDPFSFTASTGVATGTVTTSNTITVSGIDTAAPISITGSGGQYSIAGGAFTSAAGTVKNGQTVAVHVKSSSAASTAVTTTLNIGGVTAPFKVTTGTKDTTADAFTFAAQTGVATGTLVTSGTVTVAGVNAASPVSISGAGGQYSIAGGAFRTTASTVNNGQTVAVRVKSSAAANTAVSTSLTIGGTVGAFKVTTGATDTTPAAFSFAAQTNVAAATVITSNTITVSGINATTPISISGNGGQYSIAGAAFTASAGTINSGQTVAVRQKSSAASNTALSTTLTIGGVSGAFKVTTGGAVTISSLSSTSADPLTPLTVNGSGFDPLHASLSVVLTPESGGTRMVIPAFAATSTAVQFMVPPFLDTAKAMFGAGVVDVQVVQVDGTVMSTSGVLKGLSINAPPAIPAGVKAGAITAAFLGTSQAVAATVQSEASANSKFNALGTALGTYSNDLKPLNTGIGTVIGNPTATASIPTTNSAQYTLNATVLTMSDQLLLMYVHQFVSQTGTPLAAAATKSTFASTPNAGSACPSNTGDPSTDQFICSMQDYSQNVATTGAQAVQLGAKVEAGFYLSFLGGWAVDGLADAGALGTEAAEAFHAAWSLASAHIAAFATAAPTPSISDSLNTTLADLLDKAALGGLGILPAAVDSKNTYDEASKLLASSTGKAPEGGLLLNAPQTGAGTGQKAIYSFETARGATTTTDLSAPATQSVTGTAPATIQPSVDPFNGAYSGSYGGSATCSSSAGSQTGAVGGGVTLSISNGAVSVSSPGSGGGSINTDGGASYGGGSTSSASYTFSGSFSVDQKTGSAGGSGFWSASSSSCTASGSWSVAR